MRSHAGPLGFELQSDDVHVQTQGAIGPCRHREFADDLFTEQDAAGDQSQHDRRRRGPGCARRRRLPCAALALGPGAEGARQFGRRRFGQTFRQGFGRSVFGWAQAFRRRFQLQRRILKAGAPVVAARLAADTTAARADRFIGNKIAGGAGGTVFTAAAADFGGAAAGGSNQPVRPGRDPAAPARGPGASSPHGGDLSGFPPAGPSVGLRQCGLAAAAGGRTPGGLRRRRAGDAALGRAGRAAGRPAAHPVRRREATAGHRPRRGGAAAPDPGRRTDRQRRPADGREADAAVPVAEQTGRHGADRQPRRGSGRAQRRRRPAVGRRAAGSDRAGFIGGTGGAVMIGLMRNAQPELLPREAGDGPQGGRGPVAAVGGGGGVARPASALSGRRPAGPRGARQRAEPESRPGRGRAGRQRRRPQPVARRGRTVGGPDHGPGGRGLPADRGGDGGGDSLRHPSGHGGSGDGDRDAEPERRVGRSDRRPVPAAVRRSGGDGGRGGGRTGRADAGGVAPDRGRGRADPGPAAGLWRPAGADRLPLAGGGGRVKHEVPDADRRGGADVADGPVRLRRAGSRSDACARAGAGGRHRLPDRPLGRARQRRHPPAGAGQGRPAADLGRQPRGAPSGAARPDAGVQEAVQLLCRPGLRGREHRRQRPGDRRLGAGQGPLHDDRSIPDLHPVAVSVDAAVRRPAVARAADAAPGGDGGDQAVGALRPVRPALDRGGEGRSARAGAPPQRPGPDCGQASGDAGRHRPLRLPRRRLFRDEEGADAAAFLRLVRLEDEDDRRRPRRPRQGAEGHGAPDPRPSGGGASDSDLPRRHPHGSGRTGRLQARRRRHLSRRGRALLAGRHQLGRPLAGAWFQALSGHGGVRVSAADSVGSEAGRVHEAVGKPDRRRLDRLVAAQNLGFGERAPISSAVDRDPLMISRSAFRLALLTVALGALPAVASAQSQPFQPLEAPQTWKVDIGGGFVRGFSVSGDKSEDFNFTAWGSASYRDIVYANGLDGLGWNAVKRDGFHAGVQLRPRFAAGDIEGMDRPGYGADAALYAFKRLPGNVVVGGRIQHDATGDDAGLEYYGSPMQLGEGAGDDDIGRRARQIEGALPVRLGHELGVSFVDHQDDMSGQACVQAADLLTRGEAAGRIGRVRQIDQLGPLIDQAQHGVDIGAEVRLGRQLDFGLTGAGRDLIGDEGVLAGDDIVPGLQIGLVQQGEDLVRAVAEDQPLRLQPVRLGHRCAQAIGPAVGIEVDRRRGGGEGLARLLARAQRVFVGGQLDRFGDARDGALAADIGRDVQHAALGLRRAAGRRLPLRSEDGSGADDAGQAAGRAVQPDVFRLHIACQDEQLQPASARQKFGRQTGLRQGLDDTGVRPCAVRDPEGAVLAGRTARRAMASPSTELRAPAASRARTASATARSSDRRASSAGGSISMTRAASEQLRRGGQGERPQIGAAAAEQDGQLHALTVVAGSALRRGGGGPGGGGAVQRPALLGARQADDSRQRLLGAHEDLAFKLALGVRRQGVAGDEGLAFARLKLALHVDEAAARRRPCGQQSLGVRALAQGRGLFDHRLDLGVQHPRLGEALDRAVRAALAVDQAEQHVDVIGRRVRADQMRPHVKLHQRRLFQREGLGVRQGGEDRLLQLQHDIGPALGQAVQAHADAFGADGGLALFAARDGQTVRRRQHPARRIIGVGLRHHLGRLDGVARRREHIQMLDRHPRVHRPARGRDAAMRDGPAALLQPGDLALQTLFDLLGQEEPPAGPKDQAHGDNGEGDDQALAAVMRDGVGHERALAG
uniref:PE-PGRS family protein n=1 Tax=Parastrongyloides trichosuri TaxID=131310 RepID=A0A0N4ZZD0_PARTI